MTTTAHSPASRVVYVPLVDPRNKPDATSSKTDSATIANNHGEVVWRGGLAQGVNHYCTKTSVARSRCASHVPKELAFFADCDTDPSSTQREVDFEN